MWTTTVAKLGAKIAKMQGFLGSILSPICPMLSLLQFGGLFVYMWRLNLYTSFALHYPMMRMSPSGLLLVIHLGIIYLHHSLVWINRWLSASVFNLSFTLLFGNITCRLNHHNLQRQSWLVIHRERKERDLTTIKSLQEHYSQKRPYLNF